VSSGAAADTMLPRHSRPLPSPEWSLCCCKADLRWRVQPSGQQIPSIAFKDANTTSIATARNLRTNSIITCLRSERVPSQLSLASEQGPSGVHWRSNLDHDLDGFTIIHRTAAVGHTIDVRDAIEHQAGLDSTFQHRLLARTTRSVAPPTLESSSSLDCARPGPMCAVPWTRRPAFARGPQDGCGSSRRASSATSVRLPAFAVGRL
jgi:hypothetical protein